MPHIVYVFLSMEAGLALAVLVLQCHLLRDSSNLEYDTCTNYSYNSLVDEFTWKGVFENQHVTHRGLTYIKKKKIEATEIIFEI